METKANYLLIGVFTLASIIGAFALFLWLAKVEIDRQYAYYDILFDDVSGLGAAGDVRYNGLPVGQVVDLQLDEADPSKVRIRIEVGADTPINSETVAVLQSQGVTGVSFVGLSGGSDAATPLPDGAVIPSERSPLQSVFEGAPLLLERAVDLLEDINTVFDDENRQAVSDILQNVASASARLDTSLENFETLSTELSGAAQQVASFANRLEALADNAEVTLDTATETLAAARATSERATVFLERDVPRVVEDWSVLAGTATETLEQFRADVSEMASGINTFTETGTTTLQSATTAFDESLRAIDSVYDAMTSAEQTMANATDTFTSVNEILDTQIDGMITDLRGAVTGFSETVTDVSEDIDAVAEEVRSASASAASFLGTIEDIVTDNRRQVSEFLGLGLPEFIRFIEEGRLLFDTLDRLADRIERDPARFLLGTTSSEFRR
jgi:phospholipid/cholesterol/gamma-HCH transport system substrate-binding protein